jgi:predicted dehydrogenase
MAGLSIALVGAGANAADYVRVINDSPRAKLSVVIDADLDAASVLAEKAGCVMGADLGAAQDCQAAVVVTDIDQRAQAVTDLIEQGIPTLVQAPLAADLAGVNALIELSKEKGVPLACGFLERFNSALKAARGMLDESPLHLMAVRHMPRDPRHETNVIQELMVHDIDLAIQLGGGPMVDSVRASRLIPDGYSKVQLADAVITFGSGLIANFSASRLSHRTRRDLTLITTNKLIEVDLLRFHVTVTRNISAHHLLESGTPTYRENVQIDSPFVHQAGEPLALQLDQLLDLAEGRTDMAAIRNGLVPPHTHAAKVESA